MKFRINCIIFLFFSIHLTTLHAQFEENGAPGSTLKEDKSILFGYDTFINDQPMQNQRNVVVCSAFNGWPYAGYSYFDQSANMDAAAFLRSKDNGITWSVLLEGTIGLTHSAITRLDILACGHDTINMKVFVGFCIYDTAVISHSVTIGRYDKNMEFEDEILHEPSWYPRDLAIASDDVFPANNSNPFSLGVVYSKETFFGDSIVFCSSDNGGMSFNKRYNIASSTHYFHRVALAYGRSASCPSGRYFAAWEEQESENSVSGHIYTAHSEPNFNSPFTQPALLDSLDESTANNASNPVIACQNNGVDNDSSNLTEIVLFEKHVAAANSFKVAGVYNKKATNSVNFRKFSLSASGDNTSQPDVVFNAYDSTFIVTCVDSTTQQLPYYTHDFNMTDPSSWGGLTSGYNDNPNLVAPHPQVVIDFGMHTGINAWAGAGEGGNGAALFDAPFNYYTGGLEKQDGSDDRLVKIYPNPVVQTATIEFELRKGETVEISVVDIMGQALTMVAYPLYPEGKQQLRVDFSNHPSGIYFVVLHTENNLYTRKIAVK